MLQNAILQASTTLYINHSNNIAGSWTCSVYHRPSGEGVIEMRTAKVIGGKETVKFDEITQGKNIGRSNETTPKQQAFLEYLARIQKKKDAGYQTEIPQSGERPVNSLGLPKPMLAQELQPKTTLQWPLYVQPKFDGNRCLAGRVDGKVVLWSRGGKEIQVEHVKMLLEYILPRDSDLILDGELYVHGETLQTITSWIKRNQAGTALLKFMVYDCVKDVPYSERLQLLRGLNIPEQGSVVLTPTFRMDSMDLVNVYHQSLIEDGYEGTMLRHGDDGYATGKRSSSLLKKKDFQDAEFKIVGVSQGTPQHSLDSEGNVVATFNVAIFDCLAPNGSVFSVTAPGTREQKDFYWTKRDYYLNKYLTVKFFNWTPDGLPFLPVALQLREEL